MHAKSLILLFFLFISCKHAVTNGEFFEKTSSRWNYGSKISWINEHYKSVEKIATPKGTYQSIFEIEFIDANFNESYDCIQFYVPKDESDGELIIVPNPKHENCNKLITNSGYARIPDIRNFGYEINKGILKLKVDEFRFYYKFLNFDKSSTLKLLSSSIPSKLVAGVLIASKVSYSKSKNILQDGSSCFKIDDECNEIQKNECSQCTGGYYEVISSKCGTKRNRVCGVNRCGEKNKTACLRGYLASGIDPENYCIADSPLGFCNPGFKVVCINNVLMCE
jgi:hypothetical protein